MDDMGEKVEHCVEVELLEQELEHRYIRTRMWRLLMGPEIVITQSSGQDHCGHFTTYKRRRTRTEGTVQVENYYGRDGTLPAVILLLWATIKIAELGTRGWLCEQWQGSSAATATSADMMIWIFICGWTDGGGVIRKDCKRARMRCWGICRAHGDDVEMVV